MQTRSVRRNGGLVHSSIDPIRTTIACKIMSAFGPLSCTKHILTHSRPFLLTGSDQWECHAAAITPRLVKVIEGSILNLSFAPL